MLARSKRGHRRGEGSGRTEETMKDAFRKLFREMPVFQTFVSRTDGKCQQAKARIGSEGLQWLWEVRRKDSASSIRVTRREKNGLLGW